MSRAWPVWPVWIGAAVGWLSAACTLAPADPCGDASTCVAIHVDSVIIHTIDQLALDLVYNGTHATAVTGTSGDARSLPVTTAVILDVPGNPLIQLDLVAAGKLGGSVLGGDARSITIQPGNHETVDLDLMPVDPCTEGALYCGGIDDILADGESLYRCTGGFVQFYTRCMHGCSPHFQPGGVCIGEGLCNDGGTYCGGDLLDGDPGTLYVCHQFEGTVLTRCPDRCVVLGGGNDVCE
jgi:hypothetical protein